MLKNNNQAVVKKIGERTLKNNRTRNIFAILAIILTTFMFTTVFGVGFSLAENMGIMMVRQQGTISSVRLNAPDKSQINDAKKSDYLVAAGIRIYAGQGTGADMYDNVKLSLDYYDNVEFGENLMPAISDVCGSYPNKSDEIMMSKSALEALGIKKPARDMKIDIITDSEKKIFKLSGWYTDYAYSPGGLQCLVSKEYVSGLGLTVEKDGVLSMSSKSGKQEELLDDLEAGVKLNSNQKFESSYDVQGENSDNILVIAVTIGLISFMIIVSGYLLIYNVMYISVTKDIRFFGMLKAIGTSPSQIKRIVRMQAMRLSVIGIPIGIMLGIIMSFAAIPAAAGMVSGGVDSAMPRDVSFNPFIYGCTIIFAVITVSVSSRKPAKLAGNVSPVEALRYNGVSNVKIKTKKSTSGGKIYRMSFRNVFREKKRAILVFASLFMGTMAFLSVDTFLGSLKLQNYIDYYLPNDYTIYTNVGNKELEDENLNESAKELAKEIGEIKGIKSINVNLSADTILQFDEEVFKPFLEIAASDGMGFEGMEDFYKNAVKDDEKYSAPVIAVSSDMMKLYNTKARQKIDIDRFEKGEICLMGFVETDEQSDYVLGRKITITDKVSKKSKTFEVGACPTREDDHGINVGYCWIKGGAPDAILISEKALNEFCDSPTVSNIIADCEPEAESQVTREISKLVKTSPCVIYTEIKSKQISGFQTSMATMNLFSGGISIILILIGVINFINVMLTGVYTRRGELSVMESVGMTKKQVKKMLTFEGAYYGIILIGMILTIGNAIMYLIADFASKVADYATFHYPFALIVIISVVIMLICTMVPQIVYNMISKESITERLRSSN